MSECERQEEKGERVLVPGRLNCSASLSSGLVGWVGRGSKSIEFLSVGAWFCHYFLCCCCGSRSFTTFFHFPSAPNCNLRPIYSLLSLCQFLLARGLAQPGERIRVKVREGVG